MTADDVIEALDEAMAESARFGESPTHMRVPVAWLVLLMKECRPRTIVQGDDGPFVTGIMTSRGFICLRADGRLDNVALPDLAT